MKRVFNDKCPKKNQLTLGGIKAPGDNTTNAATATINTHNINESEHSQEIDNLFNDCPEDHKEPGFA